MGNGGGPHVSIDATSTLRGQLAGFLANLPGLDDARARHELLSATGFGYLEAGIDFAGANVVFVAGLLEVLTREGQAGLVGFLGALGASSSFMLGREDRQRLAELSSGIA